MDVGELTGTFHALMYEAVQQRAAVVAEGGTGVGLDLKCVLTLQVLKYNKNNLHWILTQAYTVTMGETVEKHTHLHTHAQGMISGEMLSGVFMDKPIRFLHWERTYKWECI